MNAWLSGWVIAVGFSLALAPQAVLAQGKDLAEARAAVGRSGEQSVQALNRALGLVADAEARAAIERAKDEVLEARRRAFQDLDRAERGLIPEDQGLGTALSATEKHRAVLMRVLGKVPVEARAALEHAIEVSAHGHDTVKALRHPAFSPPPGKEDRPIPPAGAGDLGGRSGPSGSPRPGR